MSGRIFENIIYQMHDIIGRELGVLDSEGYVVEYSGKMDNEEQMENVINAFADGSDFIVYNNFTFKGVGRKNKPEYIAFVAGEDEIARKYCAILAVSLENIKQYHDKKYDRGNFIKNVVLDNILPGDIEAKAKELHLPINVHWCVFLVRTYEKNNMVVQDVIQSLFHEKNKDFVFTIDDYNCILVKEMKSNYSSGDLEAIAESILEVLNGQGIANVYIGIGSVVNNIKDLAKSYKEAQVALEVGKVLKMRSI